MYQIQLAQSGNDLQSQRQFQVSDRPGPQQLDMFLIYEVQGQPCCFGDVVIPIQACPATTVCNPEPDSDSDPVSLESDNWRIQELMDEGAWSDIQMLESARVKLHEEVFEYSGLELAEVRCALKEVVARIRELAN